MIKKTLSLLLTLLLLLTTTPSISLAAEEDFAITNGTLTKYNGTSETVVIPEGITAIGAEAFQSNTQIKTVIIPEGVTTIQKYAFSKCSNLETVSLPETLKNIYDFAFYRCPSLKNLQLPKNISYIGLSAFNGCSNIGSNLVIPEGVTSINDKAFYGCAGLETVKLSEQTKLIGFESFKNCSSLKSINLPSTLNKIDWYAFQNCAKLGPEIVIPENITIIDFGTFFGCSSMTSIKLPEKLTTISNYAFKDCTSLYDISLPEGLTSIGMNTFDNCTSLKNISIPESTTNISSFTFKNCTALESISLPDSITTISNETFAGCTSLKSLKLPANLKTIYDRAFTGCKSLKNVTLPQSLETIYSRAFYDCDSIESISIPSSTTAIGSEAFYECDSLNRIYVFSKNVKLPRYSLPIPDRDFIYIYGYKGSTAETYANSFAEDEDGDLIRFIELKDDASAPDKVTNFRQGTKYCTKINLAWDKVDDCSGYEIYRYSTSSKKYELVTVITDPATTTYTDKSKLSSTTYSYKIKAFKVSASGNIYSEDSDILKATTKPLTPAFSSSSTTTSTVTLNWKPSARASGYEIYRYSTTSGKYNLIGEVTAGTTTYKDTGRTSANIYTYKVRAYKLADGKKIYSSYSDSLKVVTKPLTPKVTLSSTTSRKIKVSWTNRSTRATGYKVYMATSKYGTYKLVGTTTSSSYTKSSLTKGKTYYFKVRAYRSVSGKMIYGNYSTVKYIKCR